MVGPLLSMYMALDSISLPSNTHKIIPSNCTPVLVTKVLGPKCWQFKLHHCPQMPTKKKKKNKCWRKAEILSMCTLERGTYKGSIDPKSVFGELTTLDLEEELRFGARDLVKCGLVDHCLGAGSTFRCLLERKVSGGTL